MELINPTLKKIKKSLWVIVHVDVDYLYRVEKDLDRFAAKFHLKAGQVNSYIPTVRILRKQLKGRIIFETIPMLFSYGFIQIPKTLYSEDNMMMMKKAVPAIHSFVSDIANGNRIALVRKSEIDTLYTNLVDYSVYDKSYLKDLQVDNFVNLRGYPFDDVDAQIVDINYKTEKVKVKLFGDGILKIAEVDFDNIIYSLYHGINDESQFKEALLGDLKVKYKTNTNKYE